MKNRNVERMAQAVRDTLASSELYALQVLSANISDGLDGKQATETLLLTLLYTTRIPAYAAYLFASTGAFRAFGLQPPADITKFCDTPPPVSLFLAAIVGLLHRVSSALNLAAADETQFDVTEVLRELFYAWVVNREVQRRHSQLPADVRALPCVRDVMQVLHSKYAEVQHVLQTTPVHLAAMQQANDSEMLNGWRDMIADGVDLPWWLVPIADADCCDAEFAAYSRKAWLN